MQYFMKAAGAVLTVIGLVVLVKRIAFVLRAERVTGEVVEVVKRIRREHRRDRTYFHPKVRFTTRRGETCEVVGEVGSSRRSSRAGSNMNVLYDPSRPREVLIGSLLSIWGLPVCLLVLGVAAIYGGIRQIPGL